MPNGLKFNAETLANDIALVKLQRPVKSKLHIRKVCLPSREQHRQWISNAEQSECIVTGWGKMFASESSVVVFEERNFKVFSILKWMFSTPKQVTNMHYSWKNCQCHCGITNDVRRHLEKYSEKVFFFPTALWFVPEARQTMLVMWVFSNTFEQNEHTQKITNDLSSQGDGGGPLVCKIEKTWFQVGVVSFGDDCGRSPGVYTLVVAYLNWIKKHIGLNRWWIYRLCSRIGNPCPRRFYGTAEKSDNFSPIKYIEMLFTYVNLMFEGEEMIKLLM